MIPATEALKLPSAKLNAEETEAADKLEAAIEEHVRKFMERRGCDFRTDITNGNVIAEVNQRLKRAGYTPQWQKLIQQHKLNAAKVEVLGWGLNLAPSDSAYTNSAT